MIRCSFTKRIEQLPHSAWKVRAAPFTLWSALRKDFRAQVSTKVRARIPLWTSKLLNSRASTIMKKMRMSCSATNSGVNRTFASDCSSHAKIQYHGAKTPKALNCSNLRNCKSTGFAKIIFCKRTSAPPHIVRASRPHVRYSFLNIKSFEESQIAWAGLSSQNQHDHLSYIR